MVPPQTLLRHVKERNAMNTTNGQTKNIFGFSTAPSTGGDFTPIIKYDARAGRVFRVDRVQGADGFTGEQVDITQLFRAVFDLENVEVGWMQFVAGSAPSMALIPLAALHAGQPYPAQPSPNHKQGVRMLLKLAKNCGGDKPVREIAGVSKAFLGAIEQLFLTYLDEREKNKDPQGKYQLPVVSLLKTEPVTTGSGAQKSTNYRPTWKIDGWVPRPEDLIHMAAPAAAPATPGAAPATGSTAVPPPPDFTAAKPNLADDFG
jgi:hypothetical protein